MELQDLALDILTSYCHGGRTVPIPANDDPQKVGQWLATMAISAAKQVLQRTPVPQRDKLADAIRKHRDARGHDRCWQNDLELWPNCFSMLARKKKPYRLQAQSGRLTTWRKKSLSAI